jgi:hypothetical protein
MHIVFITNPEGKRQLGIAGYRWENNIEMYVTEIGCDDD